MSRHWLGKAQIYRKIHHSKTPTMQAWNAAYRKKNFHRHKLQISHEKLNETNFPTERKPKAPQSTWIFENPKYPGKLLTTCLGMSVVAENSSFFPAFQCFALGIWRRVEWKFPFVLSIASRLFTHQRFDKGRALATVLPAALLWAKGHSCCRGSYEYSSSCLGMVLGIGLELWKALGSVEILRCLQNVSPLCFPRFTCTWLFFNAYVWYLLVLLFSFMNFVIILWQWRRYLLMSCCLDLGMKVLICLQRFVVCILASINGEATLIIMSLAELLF